MRVGLLTEFFWGRQVWVSKHILVLGRQARGQTGVDPPVEGWGGKLLCGYAGYRSMIQVYGTGLWGKDRFWYNWRIEIMYYDLISDD